MLTAEKQIYISMIKNITISIQLKQIYLFGFKVYLFYWYRKFNNKITSATKFVYEIEILSTQVNFCFYIIYKFDILNNTVLKNIHFQMCRKFTHQFLIENNSKNMKMQNKYNILETYGDDLHVYSFWKFYINWWIFIKLPF